MMTIRHALVSAAAFHATITSAISLDLTSQDSIKAAAGQAAFNMMQLYTGNQSGNTPGLLPGPYYWWEGGAMFGALIDYWYYTGDATYNNVTTQGLLFQVGAGDYYEPANQSFDLGNDDQAFWGMAALTAAEYNFPNPPKDEPQWLALAQAVFNRQANRWDNATCGGGLRWQVESYNNGYDYKNSISNGCFFSMGARLAKYTGNTTYSLWAETTWDWCERVGLIDDKYNVYDGTSAAIGQNCTSIDHLQWSYNVGVFLIGAAYMWNITQSQLWHDRTQGLLEASATFFTTNTAGSAVNSPYIMWEIECEPNHNCDPDQLSFKAYLSRWMAATTKVAPWTTDYVMARLAPSAQAAAASCTGAGAPGYGTTCGTQWYIESWDGTSGIGQQMNALEVIQANLIEFVTSPLTSGTGGTSQGNPNAGSGAAAAAPVGYAIDKGDKAGAGILTLLFGGGSLAAAAWAMF